MSTENVPIKRAIVSVSDKTGIVDFCRELVNLGVDIISTGGTARTLRDAGLSVIEMGSYTGYPEIFDGRLKTLHPKVHGGLLYSRNVPKHVNVASESGIPPIDLLVVNLYPFAATINKPGCAYSEAIEQIDIGGPAMIRSAAKNQESVTVVSDPNDYQLVLEEIQSNDGSTTLKTRKRLAAKVFALTSGYDAAICQYLEKQSGGIPEHFFVQGKLKMPLRYGENPHQKPAALYSLDCPWPCVAHGKHLSGKEMGFNNIGDMDAAFGIVLEFDSPAAVIVKHQNPCGVGVSRDQTILTAWKLAYSGDPISAFGGVAAFNRTFTIGVAQELMSVKGFKLDAIVAPMIDPGALDLLKQKKWGREVIVMETGPMVGCISNAYDFHSIPGGILVQNPDIIASNEFENLKVVTKRGPTPGELDSLKFAWTVCKHVKSNAIVLAKDDAIVGVGAGQMSRVSSVTIAVRQAGALVKGAVLASDAFFPFADGPAWAAAAGVTAIIQPGGSQRDGEVIEVCDKHDVAMVFTGIRHFRH